MRNFQNQEETPKPKDIRSRESSVESQKKPKRLERSNVRTIFRSSSKQSLGKNQHSFYVKNICLEHLIEVKPQNNISSEIKTVRKQRQPTPCKSRSSINNTIKHSNAIENLQVENMENNIEKEKLQKKLNQLTVKLRILEKQNESMKATVQAKNMKIEKLQNKRGEHERKIKELQKLVIEKQCSLLNVTMGNNNQLIVQLKKDNEACRRMIMGLQDKNRSLNNEIQEMRVKLAALVKQNLGYQKRMKIEKNCLSESMREKYFEKQIQRLKEMISNSDKPELYESLQLSEVENAKMRDEIKKLNIQLDYIERKHLGEIQVFAKVKNNEIATYKKLNDELSRRYEEACKFICENASKCNEITIKVKNTVYTTKSRNGRSSTFSYKNSTKSNSSVSLSLSPQSK